MHFPLTGVLILIIGLWFFFFSPKLLYASMIVAIPFSATVIVNLGSGEAAKGFAAWLFLAGLWVIRESLSGTPPWHRRGWFTTRQARCALLAFLAAVLLSLCVPLVLNGTSWVPTVTPPTSQTVPLQVSLYDVTQIAYLLFGVVLAIFVAAENCQPSRLLYTMRLYVGSCVFAAAWGLFEFGCNLTSHAYPVYLFNTDADISSLGYKEALTLGAAKLGRISSVALEPSVLGEELLVALVVLLVGRRLKQPILSKKWDLIAIVSLLAALLVTTSTTAYIGLLITLLIAAFSLSRAGRPAKGYYAIFATMVATGVLVVLAVPLVRQLMNLMILEKLHTGSGAGRLHSVIVAAHDFLKYPILGTGWHTVNSWDLVFLLLANTGIVGLLAFASFLLPVLRGLWNSAVSAKPTTVAALSAVLLIVILSEAAGLTYAAGYVWLILGLGAGAAASKELSAGQRRWVPRTEGA